MKTWCKTVPAYEDAAEGADAGATEGAVMAITIHSVDSNNRKFKLNFKLNFNNPSQAESDPSQTSTIRVRLSQI